MRLPYFPRTRSSPSFLTPNLQFFVSIAIRRFDSKSPPTRDFEHNRDFSATDQRRRYYIRDVSSVLVCSCDFLGRPCNCRAGDWCRYWMAHVSPEHGESAKHSERRAPWVTWIRRWFFRLHVYAVAPKHCYNPATWRGNRRNNDEQIPTP